MRQAPNGLTFTELQAAKLAAAGLNNAEIGAKLFISRRTVESNLARACRKLAIHSRAELHAALQLLED